MTTRALTESEFKATFREPMQDITGKEPDDVLDIWPYVGSIPPPELEGHTIHDRLVEYVYRSGDKRFDHVLVMTKTWNVYLVVVVDLAAQAVYGHRLLDLRREYGPPLMED